MQRKVLTRVARGAYVQTSALLGHRHLADRHVLRARALLRWHPDGWAASHTTATLLWDLPLLDDGLDGLEGAAALAAEKRREDRIRPLGYGVGRVVWPDLEGTRAVDAIVRQTARARPAIIASGWSA